MNKNLFEQIREELWVIVLDIIAVNAAYMLTFFLRYYVHANFVSAAVPFVSGYLRFAPFYTVLCLVVFAVFGLYNGMWRYASVNDMNRIIAANGVSVILLFIGTSVFTERLPVNIYAIGAGLQFLFTVIIRYAYRLFEMEKRKLSKGGDVPRNVMVIGTDINAGNIIRYLTGDSLYKPVVAAGSDKNGKYVYGLPVVQNIEMAMTQYDIDCVIVADPVLSDRKREALRRVCEHNSIELHDYSGFLRNQSGNMPLTSVTQVVSGEVKVRLGEQTFDSVEQAMQALSGRYSVVEITGDNLVIEIQESDKPTAEWATTYKQVTGEDVSFF